MKSKRLFRASISAAKLFEQVDLPNGRRKPVRFISVSASNLQAILYMVVEMRFLVPFQYVAFELPFHIPYQSGALVCTTSCNMATLHTLIAILLSHLRALYNIITFVIIISLFSGRRGGHCNSATAPTGGRQRCRKRRSQRGRWPRRRLYYYTKVGSRDRGLVAERGSLESLTDVNHALREVKSGALSGHRTIAFITDSNEPRW
jgi:hypothetical protein